MFLWVVGDIINSSKEVIKEVSMGYEGNSIFKIRILKIRSDVIEFKSKRMVKVER